MCLRQSHSQQTSEASLHASSDSLTPNLLTETSPDLDQLSPSDWLAWSCSAATLCSLFVALQSQFYFTFDCENAGRCKWCSDCVPEYPLVQAQTVSRDTLARERERERERERQKGKRRWRKNGESTGLQRLGFNRGLAVTDVMHCSYIVLDKIKVSGGATVLSPCISSLARVPFQGIIKNGNLICNHRSHVLDPSSDWLSRQSARRGL